MIICHEYINDVLNIIVQAYLPSKKREYNHGCHEDNTQILKLYNITQDFSVTILWH